MLEFQRYSVCGYWLRVCLLIVAVYFQELRTYVRLHVCLARGAWPEKANLNLEFLGRNGSIVRLILEQAINGDLSSVQIRDALSPHIDNNDELLVFVYLMKEPGLDLMKKAPNG